MSRVVLMSVPAISSGKICSTVVQILVSIMAAGSSHAHFL